MSGNDKRGADAGPELGAHTPKRRSDSGRMLEGKVSLRDMDRPPRRGRLLIVEPNADVARVLEVRLARDGHEVVIVTTGKAALASAKDHAPDVALVDRGVSDVPSLDLIERLRGMAESMEVILMTVDPTTEIAVAAIDRGAFDTVGKPFSNLKLVTSKVNNAVGKVHAERDRAELARVLYEQTQDLAEREAEAEASKSSDILPVLTHDDDEDDTDTIDFDDMSGVDPLTGIANRRASEQRFRSETARALRYDRPLCIALASVDGLSDLIEAEGGDVGDGVLRGIVQLFIGMVRDVDFIARREGGEFFFLFPETTKENGIVVLERIRVRIAQTSFSDVVDGDHDIKLSVCFGVAGLPADTMNVDRLERAAETALRHAKTIQDVVVPHGSEAP